MITKITAKNANKYRVLFAKATEALRTHSASGELVTATNGLTPIITGAVSYAFVEDMSPALYVAGELWVGETGRSINAETGLPEYATYRQTELSEHYDSTKDYFIQSVSGEINSLEEYFLYIADLKKINPIYTILPIDENLFEIDANTREITVPDEFKKNGVSVQSDEISEVLYFRIDRFFDMEDLTNEDIFIEWRAPNGIEGVSMPWAIDVESQPGYIIFGWPLSSEITAVPGNVTFSVRFYRFREEEHTLQYSLSTLTNSVVIKPGIALEKSVRQTLETPGAITDVSQLLEERIINSDAANAGNTPVMPQFDTKAIDIDEKYASLTPGSDIVIATKANGDYDFYSYIPALESEYTGGKYDEYRVYLTNPETGAEGDGIYRIRSTVADTGRIGYAWIKISDAGVVLNSNLFTNGDVYLPTTDTEYNQARVYYIKSIVDNREVYTIYADDDSINPSAVEIDGVEQPLYERWAQVDLNSSYVERSPADHSDFVLGKYQPRVTNTLYRRTVRTYGPVVRVCEPARPVITQNLPAHAIFEDGEEGLVANLFVKAQVDAHGYTYFEWMKQGLDENEQPTWVKAIADTLDENEQSVVHNINRVAERVGDDESSEVTSQIFKIPGAEYGLENNGDGMYKCVVHTLLNSMEKVNPEAAGLEGAAAEALVRITHAASPAELDYNQTAEDILSLETTRFNVNAGTPMLVGFKANGFENRTAEDYYTYQWYRYTASTAEQTVIDQDNALLGTYEVKATDIPVGTEHRIETADLPAEGFMILPENVIPQTTGVNDNGYYFCIITNHYNGSTSVQSSAFIYNVDVPDDQN